jgi:SAM-dependent methyltransferase
MARIEQRFEGPRRAEPDYLGRVLTEKEIAAGAHRAWIGGHWADHGVRQLNFLTTHGLRPEYKFLDVGCGSFRAGRHLVDYLLPGNYYGIDANLSVMQAGYDNELTEAQRDRLPTSNLRATDRFDVDFGVQFDMAIAQSVFTHISLNHIRLALYRVAKVMRPGGRFFTTFNEQPESFPVDGVVSSKRPKYTERNVYWYYRKDLRWAAKFAPWEYRYIGKWGHPGGQRMIEFIRRPAAETEPGVAGAADRDKAGTTRWLRALREKWSKGTT